jgi:hypothetical protein
MGSVWVRSQKDLTQQDLQWRRKSDKRKQEAAAGANTVTNSIVSDCNRARHGGDVRDVGVCVAEPGRRKALHINWRQL